MSHKASYMIKHLTHVGDTRRLRDADDVKCMLKAGRDGRPPFAHEGRKVTASEKGILMQIADDHNEDRGCAWPSIPNLAPRVGLSVKQTQRLVQQLCKAEILESRPRLRDDNGARSSNEYRFWFDDPFDRVSSRATEQRMRMQAVRTATRPVQMKLDPPPADGRGYPPIQGVAPLPSAGIAPSHPRPVPPPIDDRGPLPSAGGQELVLELPEKLPKELPAEVIPLPPDVRGVVGLILPFADCTIADPGFGLAVGLAARWVMEQLGITKLRLEATIAASLRLECQQRRSQTLDEVASMAVSNWRTYLADQELMRFGPWSPAKFFGEGYWAKPHAWPYDQNKVNAAKRASVGTWRPS